MVIIDLKKEIEELNYHFEKYTIVHKLLKYGPIQNIIIVNGNVIL
jgi:hypothetical protein